ncbi:hypothetical protein CSA56_00030 [candidate division KSB3 bacterium]|uniref:Surface carbohydrate biosynthesis protein n=1 Tax=candidate division KSB3 bacterium TaxID=2044937 RepID=A0A2G6KLP9_9BACT|nr:MAG: hypothetical protein CSA56_00030 [candidate division KSB3 bacterium]
MNNTRLYIGVETKAREFDAKLLLACFAAEAGFDTVLGQQKIFVKRLAEMPRGIWINKSISPSKTEAYKHYKKLGVILAGYDEEGLAPFNADEYKKRRISVESLRQLECFFAWGQWQADVIAERAPSEAHRVVQVGHPRVDLTRREFRAFYDDEVKKIREQYGQFLLINTNFSFYNHFHGKDGKIAMFEKAGKIADEAQRDYYLRLRDHKKTLFYEFAEIVRILRRRFPDATVVLRPHPSENHDYWREILPQDGKTHVVYEGTVLPWLMAADVMIHNSCSTGIEGYLLERPVITYRPIQAEEFENTLPNLLSEHALSREELLQKVEYYLTRDRSVELPADEEKRRIAGRYIASLDGPFSCERTVERLSHIQREAKPLEIFSYRAFVEMKRIAKGVLRRILRRQPVSTATTKRQDEYRSQKFPGISLGEIQQGLIKYQQITGRFSDLRVAQIGKNLFQFERKI